MEIMLLAGTLFKVFLSGLIIGALLTLAGLFTLMILPSKNNGPKN